MRKLYLYLLVISLLCPLVRAQSLSVTATITDSDSQTWNNGGFSVQLVSPHGAPFYNGTAISTGLITGTINSSGALGASLYNTSTITPGGAYYNWIICSNTSAPCSVFSTQVITTNLSSLLSSMVRAPRFAAGPGSYGYLDAEVAVLPAPGGFYYNVSTPIQRVWNGSGWVNNGGGSGSMTWPALAGIANYAGSNAWGTSYNASNLIPANFVSTLNQNTTGTASNITATTNASLVTLSALSLPYSQVTGGPSSSGTVANCTTQYAIFYAATTGTTATCDTYVTDNGTTFAVLRPLSAPSISTTGTAGTASPIGWSPGTTLPTLQSGMFAILGPNAASITAFAWQAPAATNGSAGLVHVGANASGVSQLIVSQVAIADLSATGTPSSTTYLRGDNTWSTPAGGVSVSGTPTTNCLTLWTSSTAIGNSLLCDSGTLATYSGSAGMSLSGTSAQLKVGASAPTVTSGTAGGAVAVAGTAPTLIAGDGGWYPNLANTCFDIFYGTNDLGCVAPLISPTFTGTPAVPTATAGTNTTQIASTAFNTAAVLVETNRATAAEALKAPLASPALTGVPTAPTASVGTNTTQVATMAAIIAALPVSGAITSATGGSGTGTITCLTAACTNLRGTYSVAGGTFTTGTFLTLVWPTTTTAYVCTVVQNGLAPLGFGHSVATATGMTITNSTTIATLTVTLDYSCKQ